MKAKATGKDGLQGENMVRSENGDGTCPLLIVFLDAGLLPHADRRRLDAATSVGEHAVPGRTHALAIVRIGDTRYGES